MRSCFLHRAAYITPLVRQSPPSFCSIVIFFVTFVIWLTVEMFWHNLQLPHERVDVDIDVDLLFLMRYVAIDLVRLNATNGLALKILAVFIIF